MSERERDYVLGTDDPEIARLGLQHAVWRERALAGWRRAGVKRGRTVVDLGCGPGYATLDLAEIVGPTGKVIAVDRSHRFLEALARAGLGAGEARIETLGGRRVRLELDLPKGQDVGPALAEFGGGFAIRHVEMRPISLHELYLHAVRTSLGETALTSEALRG